MTANGQRCKRTFILSLRSKGGEEEGKESELRESITEDTADASVGPVRVTELGTVGSQRQVNKYAIF
jgi:hypothetical protein